MTSQYAIPKQKTTKIIATMPETAKEWASKTDFSKLPERARKKKKKSKDKSDCTGEKALELATEFETQVKASLEPQ